MHPFGTYDGSPGTGPQSRLLLAAIHRFRFAPPPLSPGLFIELRGRRVSKCFSAAGIRRFDALSHKSAAASTAVTRVWEALRRRIRIEKGDSLDVDSSFQYENSTKGSEKTEKKSLDKNKQIFSDN